MTRRKFQSIDEYIASFPKETQEILWNLKEVINKVAPEATETISYEIPTFKLNGNLVHFAAFEKHIGFYPTPEAIKAFKKELDQYKSAKGSVQFPLNKPLPISLIRKIVEFRMKQNLKNKN